MKKSDSKKGRPLKYTIKQVREAILGSAGLRTQIAERLKCSRDTVNEYLERYPELRQAVADEEEKVLDMADGALFAQIQQGELPAIFYYLNNKGKKRGYNSQTVEISETEKEISGVLVTPGLVDADLWEKATSDKENKNGKQR